MTAPKSLKSLTFAVLPKHEANPILFKNGAQRR